MRYGMAHSSKVHILDDAGTTALCGVIPYQPVFEEVAPAQICLSCFKSAQRLGLIGFMACPHCGGTGKVAAA